MAKISFTDLIPERHTITMEDGTALAFRSRAELDVEELAALQSLMNQTDDLQTRMNAKAIPPKAKGQPRGRRQAKQEAQQAHILKLTEEMKGILGDILQTLAVDPIPDEVLAGIPIGLRGKMVRWLADVSQEEADAEGNANNQPSQS